ncbi:MAG: LysR family transcriptional regulator [Proteobacteria bacterium]|nr:LysR family transcriptional regulator [Pseudomonadota bacterium]
MVVTHLRSLQALELALRTGSLQAAAEVLWLTPAAVGQRIKALEEYLGVDLLVRGRSGLRPTAELSAALAHLRTAFEELDAAAALLNLQRGDQIHLAAMSDFVELWLRPRLRTFAAEHPQIQFCINGEGDAPLRIGDVDCEIRFGAEQPAVSESDLLFRDFVLPVASPENAHRLARLKPSERLEGFPLLHVDFYRDDREVPNWSDWAEAHGCRRTDPNRGIRFQRIQPALEAVGANAGVALCGLALSRESVERSELCFPFPVSTGRWSAHAFRADFRPKSVVRPQVKAFRQWLLAEATLTRDWLSRICGVSEQRPKPSRRKLSR